MPLLYTEYGGCCCIPKRIKVTNFGGHIFNEERSPEYSENKGNSSINNTTIQFSQMSNEKYRKLLK